MGRRLLLLSFFVFSLQMNSQKREKTILVIGNQKFSVEEFEYIYNKNNSVSQNPISKDEYLSLFVNYKLKVEAAKEAGLDTLTSFINELNYYHSELSKPFLCDKKAEEQIINEAYERMLYEVDAGHILIMLNPDALPQDTLQAWNKALQAQDELLKGEDFSQVALRYSEDPTVTRNFGRLGYFTAFQMVYPFESGAYNTPVGTISPIVRSAYGYHLIKVYDKRTASGEIHVAHIMKMLPQNASVEQVNESKLVIDSVYRCVVDGEDFSSLARQYSDDQQSSLQGGELPWFNRGSMVPSFSEVAFSLKNNNDVSQPFRTPFGWHIVKRLDFKPIGTKDEERDKIVQRLGNDERSHAGVQSLVNSLKKSYHLKVDSSVLKSLMELIQSETNDSILSVKATALKGTLYAFDGGSKNIDSFVAGLADLGLLKSDASGHYLFDFLEREQEKSILDYERTILHKKSSAFRYLLQEYHDGLLVFEISQKMIWDMASSDTLALKLFYENNIQRYSTPVTFRGTVYVCSSVEAANKLRMAINSKKKYTPDQLKSIAERESKLYCGDFFYGNDADMDALLWNNSAPSNPLIVTNGIYEYDKMVGFDQVRGAVVSDFQTYLEDEWMKELHRKYHPKIYRKALK